jgi:hypothetical protein
VEAGEDGLGCVGGVDRGDDLEAPVTAGTLEHVDCEDAAQQLRPRQAARSGRLESRSLGDALRAVTGPASNALACAALGLGAAGGFSRHTTIARPWARMPYPMAVAAIALVSVTAGAASLFFVSPGPSVPGVV